MINKTMVIVGGDFMIFNIYSRVGDTRSNSYEGIYALLNMKLFYEFKEQIMNLHSKDIPLQNGVFLFKKNFEGIYDSYDKKIRTKKTLVSDSFLLKEKMIRDIAVKVLVEGERELCNYDYLENWAMGKVVFLLRRVGNEYFWIMDEYGINKLRLAFFAFWAGSEYSIYFSWCGIKIAFKNGTTKHLMVMNVDGTNQTHIYTSTKHQVAFPTWSPDGSKMTFRDGPYIYYNLWVVNSDGSNSHNLTMNRIYNSTASCSPGGTKIEYTRRYIPPCSMEVWVMNSDGSNIVKCKEFRTICTESSDRIVEEPNWLKNRADNFLESSNRYLWTSIHIMVFENYPIDTLVKGENEAKDHFKEIDNVMIQPDIFYEYYIMQKTMQVAHNVPYQKQFSKDIKWTSSPYYIPVLYHLPDIASRPGSLSLGTPPHRRLLPDSLRCYVSEADDLELKISLLAGIFVTITIICYKGDIIPGEFKPDERNNYSWTLLSGIEVPFKRQMDITPEDFLFKEKMVVVTFMLSAYWYIAVIEVAITIEYFTCNYLIQVFRKYYEGTKLFRKARGIK